MVVPCQWGLALLSGEVPGSCRRRRSRLCWLARQGPFAGRLVPLPAYQGKKRWRPRRRSRRNRDTTTGKRDLGKAPARGRKTPPDPGHLRKRQSGSAVNPRKDRRKPARATPAAAAPERLEAGACLCYNQRVSRVPGGSRPPDMKQASTPDAGARPGSVERNTKETRIKAPWCSTAAGVARRQDRHRLPRPHAGAALAPLPDRPRVRPRATCTSTTTTPPRTPALRRRRDQQGAGRPRRHRALRRCD